MQIISIPFSMKHLKQDLGSEETQDLNSEHLVSIARTQGQSHFNLHYIVTIKSTSKWD